MGKRWHLFIMVGILALVSCSRGSPSNDLTLIPTDQPTEAPTQPPTTPEQPEATAILVETPTLTSSLTPTSVPPPTKSPVTDQVFKPAGPVQINLFRLVPSGFLGAGYCSNRAIRADPDLSAAFEASPDSCPFLDSQNLDIDGLMGASVSIEGAERVSMGIVYILSGDFAGLTLPELLQEMTLEDPVPQVYLDFDLMVAEGDEQPNFALTILDETTIVFGEENGVKAVLDTAISQEPGLLADLGTALPQVVYATVLRHCPQYEDLGCTAVVMAGLVQWIGTDLSLIKFYQFDDPKSAAKALESILAAGEAGRRIQFGSVDMIGDTVTQDERFILVEGFISVGEIEGLFR